MLAVIASAVDAFHALLMVLWVAGLPLLFWHRWRRATVAYGVFALLFAALNQGSNALLGECFLTTLARALWRRAGQPPAGVDEWFTVRFANAVFHLTPSHRSIKLVTEALIVATAAGTLYAMHRLRKHAKGGPPRGLDAKADPTR
jgi:hypothetical protein